MIKITYFAVLKDERYNTAIHVVISLINKRDT